MNLGIFDNLWIRRELIWHLAILDLKNRYRNSVFGFGWTILEPLLMLTVLYLVFTNIFKTNIENYALYLLIGIVIWNMFSRGTTMNTVSILNRAHLITKQFFPREILVASTTITAFLMMVFELIVIGAFFVGTQFIPPISIFFVIPVIGILFVLTIAISLPLSVLNIRYRDVAVIWNVVIQAGFFLSPIIYKIEFLPLNIQKLLWFNPMTHVIDFAHNFMLYETYPNLYSIIYLVFVTLALLVMGIIIFRKYNPRIVEEL